MVPMGLVGGSSQDFFQWLGSPPFVSHEWPFGRGPTNPIPRGQQLARGINHLLTGKILQVGGKGVREGTMFFFLFFFGGGGRTTILGGCECYRDGPERNEVLFFQNLRANKWCNGVVH